MSELPPVLEMLGKGGYYGRKRAVLQFRTTVQ